MSATEQAMCVSLIDAVGPLQIVVGADEVLTLDGAALPNLAPQLRAAVRLAPRWAHTLIESFGHSPAELLLGVTYVTCKGTTFLIREATLEEVAAAAAKRLRSARGLQLRREQASRIADAIDALAQRAAQRAGQRSPA